MKTVFNNRIEWRNERGDLHRLDGPAIKYSSGSNWWYQNGARHRLDGPASEWADGSKEWWNYGKLHRLDGPAADYNNGYRGWYINGNQFSSEEKWFAALTEEQQLDYILKGNAK